MIKFDWLTWWAGRRWGAGILRMLTTSPRALRWAQRVTTAHSRIVYVAVVLAMLPGVPTAVVYALAGMAGIRLTTFLVLDLCGALAMTGLVAGLGFALGQHAVDVVLLIDQYATVVSLSLIGLALTVPLIRRLLRRSCSSTTP
jgi:membrane protein DedA with SNARE-associated domain